MLTYLFPTSSFKSIDPTHNHASAHPKESGSTISFTVKDKETDDASELSVSEVSTRYLRRLVQSASDYIGKKVTSAVVTIPTNFSDAQKAALVQAAKDADLEILQLIADPIAAALAYDSRPESLSTDVQDKIIVVADLGGTRSDVAVVASRGGMYTILATAHDYEFAGFALDKVLMEHFSKEFIKKHKTDPRENARSLAKLKNEAEATKKALSLGTNASFSVESLADGIDFASTINRLRYEMIARSVFEGINRLVEGVVKKAGLDVLDIDEVIMSGGTSHTPRIAANFGAIFPESTAILSPSTSATAVNPSELGARGAALQASLIEEFDVEDIEQSIHPAVTTVKHVTNAIGVLTKNGEEEVFTPIIAPETALPARRTVHVDAPKAGGDVLIKIVEGNTHIKVTQPEPKAKENGDEKPKKDADDEDDDDSDFSDDEEEEQEKREKIWKIGSTLAEAAVRGVKAGAKVEVTINVLADLSITVATREVGAKGGVRGQIPA